MNQLKAAIDANDFEQVKALMTVDPDLHRAPMGYNNNGPLTWAAECRVPYAAPAPERLAIVQWMIDHGSDIHQGGDGPLMRASLNADRIPMMELLVRNGADVNAHWNGWFPIIFSPCESVDPDALRWLLDHGANPNPKPDMSALDYLIGSYVRSDELPACIEILLDAGGTTRYDLPGVLDVLRGRMPDPGLIRNRYRELDCGSTGGRRLLLTGGTLLHVAAEFGCIEAARFLLDQGADPNARADGIGQTPLFHCATQFGDSGVAMTQLLLERGADPNMFVAGLPGHYEREDEFVDGTVLAYALRFPGGETAVTEQLRLRGARE